MSSNAAGRGRSLFGSGSYSESADNVTCDLGVSSPDSPVIEWTETAVLAMDRLRLKLDSKSPLTLFDNSSQFLLHLRELRALKPSFQCYENRASI
jgi:hypothetical protein